MIIGLQSVWILYHRKPEVLEAVGIESAVHHILSRTGLVARDPFWALSRDEDRTQLKQALQSVDQYSTYLSEDQFESFSIDSRQEYEGIGVSLMSNPQGAEVRDVFEGSPAERFGMHRGDVITRINDLDVRGWNFSRVVHQIRGTAGTELKLQVLRDQQIIDLVLQRSAIDIPSVRGVHRTEDGVLYLKIDQFGEKTDDEFYEALRAHSTPALQGIVIDLRNNMGGVMQSSIDMLDAFYDRGELMLQTRSTEGDRERIYHARRPRVIHNTPVVILVNRNSASASEILAGSLQVTGKATIVGETTLGKGSIQTVYRMRRGDAYKKTSSYYFFPDGSTIHEVGIQPDVRIPLSDNDYTTQRMRERQGIAPYAAEGDPYWSAALRSLQRSS